MSSAVLSDKDINASAPPQSDNTTTTDGTAADNNKPKSMEYHRQVLQSRLNGDSKQQTYISPSDNIMSPCTQKLSAMKNKHFTKAKPQSLFGKHPLPNTSDADKSSGSVSNGDVKKGSPLEEGEGQ